MFPFRVLARVLTRIRDPRLPRLIVCGLLSLTLLGMAMPLTYAALRPRDNPIIRANRLAGTTAWQSRQLTQAVQRTAHQRPPSGDEQPPAKARPKAGSSAITTLDEQALTFAARAAGATPAPQTGCTGDNCWSDTPIRGYASQTSINAGQAITFYVGTTDPSYSLAVFRMGWYGGAGAHLVSSVASLPGQNPSVPSPDPTTGEVELSWSPSYTLQTDSTWVSGVYLVKLVGASSGYATYIIFVVRNDSQQADIAYELPMATYQAYNDWGGKSLYEFNSTAVTTSLGTTRATQVSFDRPYALDDGAGSFFDDDFAMVRYLEKNGYNVTYLTSTDTNTSPSLLSSRKVFLTDWHDEYWSAPMRANLTSAFQAGTNLAFFSANSIFWQIRFATSSGGIANRVIVCYKDASLDPDATSNPTLTTVQWRDPPVNRPEDALLGIMYGDQLSGDQPWVVSNASSWVYTGTGLRNGDSIPNMVGYEFDQVHSDATQPSNITVISASPVSLKAGGTSTANSAYYTAANGALVFDAGSIDWATKLDNNLYSPNNADARVQQMMANILSVMITGALPLPPTPTPSPKPYYSTVLGDKPVAYWRLGESSGTAAADVLGAHNGTYRGGVTLGQPGAITNDPNTAVRFNGSSGYVDVPYSSALNTPAFSVEVWAYPTSTSSNALGVVCSRTYPYGWVLYQYGGEWEGWINNGSGGMSRLYGPTVALNTWTHLVLTSDGTTASLYVNGQIVAGVTNSSYTPNTTQDLTIGQGEPGANFWYPGLLDEVAVYNAMLSPDQVQAHYQAGVAGPAPTPTPSPTPTLTPTPTPTLTPSPTATPTPTTTPTPTLTVTPTPTATPTPTPSPTPPGSSYYTTVLGDHPTSYWRLGESSGTVAADAVGAHSGTYKGGVTLGQPGALTNDPNTSVRFNGTSGYVDVPYAGALNTPAFSVEVWVYPTSTSSNAMGIVCSRTYPDGWVLYQYGKKWDMWINNGSGMSRLIGPTVALNTWTYLVATFTGSKATLYVNGKAVASAPISSYTPNTTQDLTIGQGEPDANFWYAGRTDEVAVYAAALTSTQVQAHYQAGKNG